MTDQERFRNILNCYARVNEIEQEDLMFVFNYAEQQQEEIERLRSAGNDLNNDLFHERMKHEQIIKRYENALQFYASKENYHQNSIGLTFGAEASVLLDGGKIARAALEGER